MIHDLKTWPEPYDAVARGDKRHEWRKDDRGFSVGDTLRLRLRLYEPQSQRSPGDYMDVAVTYVSRAPDFGIPAGFCVMTIRPWPLFRMDPAPSRPTEGG